MNNAVMARPAYMPRYRPGPECVLYLEGQQDAKSGVIKDKSGFLDHGTITGATWVRLSSGLWVLSFDGVDDSILTVNNCGITGNSPCSIIMWVKPTAAPIRGAAICGFGTAAPKCLFHLVQGFGGHWYFWGHSYDYDTGVDPTLNIWQMHMVTFDGTFVHWYMGLNGIFSEIGAGGVMTDLTVGVSQIRFGIEITPIFMNDYYKGFQALQRITTGAKTVAQGAAIYQNERPLFGV